MSSGYEYVYIKFPEFPTIFPTGGCGDAGTEANGHPGSGTEGQAPTRGWPAQAGKIFLRNFRKKFLKIDKKTPTPCVTSVMREKSAWPAGSRSFHPLTLYLPSPYAKHFCPPNLNSTCAPLHTATLPSFQIYSISNFEAAIGRTACDKKVKYCTVTRVSHKFVWFLTILHIRLGSRGLQRYVVYHGWPIAPSYMSPDAGGGGELRGLSQWVHSCTQEPK